MKIFYIMLITASCAVYAEDSTFFKIREENIKFYNYPNLRLTISKKCNLALQNKICKNLSFLNKISSNKTRMKHPNEQNIASTICSEIIGGKVYIGIDKNNNETSFCQLKDLSYLDVATIGYYADRNDGLTTKPRRSKK